MLVDDVAACTSRETGWSYSGSPTIDRCATRSLPPRSSCGDTIDCRTYFSHYTHPGHCANLNRRANLDRRANLGRRAQLHCRRIGRAVPTAGRRAARHLQRCGDGGRGGGGFGHGPIPVLATSLPATGGRAVAAPHLRSYPFEPAEAILPEPVAAYARARTVPRSWSNGAPRVGIGSPTRPEGWRAAVPRACSHGDRHWCGRDPAQRLRSADATEGYGRPELSYISQDRRVTLGCSVLYYKRERCACPFSCGEERGGWGVCIVSLRHAETCVHRGRETLPARAKVDVRATRRLRSNGLWSVELEGRGAVSKGLGGGRAHGARGLICVL